VRFKINLHSLVNTALVKRKINILVRKHSTYLATVAAAKAISHRKSDHCSTLNLQGEVTFSPDDTEDVIKTGGFGETLQI